MIKATRSGNSKGLEPKVILILTLVLLAGMTKATTINSGRSSLDDNDGDLDDSVETWRLLISRITGYMSLYIWIIASVPQIIENYQLKSGEGLAALTFWLWLIGDLFNFIGAIRQGVVWTAILISTWYISSDVIIMTQIYYYKFVYKRKDDVIGEASSLLGGLGAQQVATSSDVGSGGDGGVADRDQEADQSNLLGETGQAELPSSRMAKDLALTLVLLIFAVVIPTVWEVMHMEKSSKGLKLPNTTRSSQNGKGIELDITGQIFGYISAIIFIGARIPQFIKNYQDKSIHGLSLGLYILTSLANITYSISIFAYSNDPDYLIANIPFLLGSLGVLAEDILFYYQFYIYHGNARNLYNSDGH